MGGSSRNLKHGIASRSRHTSPHYGTLTPPDFLPQEEEPELQNTSEAALAVAGGERKKGGRRFSAISRWLIPRDSVHEVGGGGGEACGMQAQNGAANGASAHGNPLAEKLNSFSTAQLKAAAALDLDEYSATVVSDESLAEHTTLPPAVFVTKSWRLQNTGARDWAGVMLVALAPPAILPEDARESGQSATTPATTSKASAPPQPSPKTPGKFRLGGGGRGAAAAATPPPPPQPVAKAAEGSRIDPVAPGETGRVSVPLKSPDVAGRYLVWFQLHTAHGKPFGARFFSELTVVGRDAESGEQDRAKANWVASMDVAQLRAALLAAPVALPPPPVQPQPSTPVSPSTRLSSTSAEVLSAVASGGLVDGMDTDEEGQSDGSDE